MVNEILGRVDQYLHMLETAKANYDLGGFVDELENAANEIATEVHQCEELHTDEYHNYIVDTLLLDIDDMPLHINDEQPWRRTIAKWRMKIGK